MTPDKARAAADALIDIQRQQARARRNFDARPVPWYYRVPELDALDPWERNERVAAARREVERRWQTVLAMVVFAAFAGWLAWAAGLMQEKTSRIVVFSSLAIMPMHFVRAFFVRRHLRRHAARVE